ncbi:MAG: RpoL/Rpb11 RNA polymerase subunit family protein [Candidatus Micrarchaeia archaeon]
MQVKVIEDTKDSLILEIEGADRSAAELVKEKLLENDNVKFAAVVKEHPEVGNPKLVIKGERLKQALSKAVGEAEDEVKELESKLQKK